MVMVMAVIVDGNGHSDSEGDGDWDGDGDGDWAEDEDGDGDGKGDDDDDRECKVAFEPALACRSPIFKRTRRAFSLSLCRRNVVKSRSNAAHDELTLSTTSQDRLRSSEDRLKDTIRRECDGDGDGGGGCIRFGTEGGFK